ncbi:MAG: hypothetical protein R2853_19060 [Thermomicrobiales bacterium]
MVSAGLSSSRRAILHAGGLAALAGALTTLPAGAQGDPGLTTVQAFASGLLFPTQGDAAGGPPYTLILWGADGRGLLAFTPEWAAVLNSGALLAALAAGAEPQAAVVLPAPADGTGRQRAWGVKLVSGSPGSDPTPSPTRAIYWMTPLLPDWLGTAVTAPDGAATFGPGYLVLIGLEGLDISENAAVRIALG